MIRNISFARTTTETGCGRDADKRTLRRCLWVVAGASVFSITAPWAAIAQSNTAAAIYYDDAARTFRLDGANVTYVLGVNQAGQLQSLYWGKRLHPSDSIPAARADRGTSSFDLPVNATPQEFVGWGGGLVVVPDVKITFPDGNRDLVLRYVSHTIQGDTLTIAMKDISRDVTVALR